MNISVNSFGHSASVKQAFKIMHDEVCMLLCLLELLQIVHFPSMVLVCSHFNFALFLLSF
jgi:hypothetical protein